MSATIGYYLYLWKSRKVYEIDRFTLMMCLLMLLVSYVITYKIKINPSGSTTYLTQRDFLYP